eukprot:3265763-Pyramimonas_sp.AAC.1
MYTSYHSRNSTFYVLVSAWLGSIQALESTQPPERKKQNKGGGRGSEGQERKLLLQLEARMRERETIDMHFKDPTGHPVLLSIKASTIRYDELVKEASAGHEYGSPHLHAAAA